MLTLRRRVGEFICIGDDITVTVAEIRGTQVMLDVKAPKHVQVHRSEVYAAIQNEQAMGTEITKSKLDKLIRGRTLDHEDHKT